MTEIQSLNTIQGQWEKFSIMVLPPGVSDLQVQEMRNCFYAGAEAMRRIEFYIGGQNVSEAAGIAILQGIQEELQTYAADLLKKHGIRLQVSGAGQSE